MKLIILMITMLSIEPYEILSHKDITIKGDPRCDNWNSIEMDGAERIICIPSDEIFIGDFE